MTTRLNRAIPTRRHPGRSNGPKPPAPRPRRGWLRLPREVRLSITIAGMILVAMLVLLAFFRVTRGGTLPGLELASVDIGGLGEAEVQREIEGIEDRFGSEEITIAGPSVEGADDVSVTATKAELGYSFDIAATVEDAMHRGRQGNPLAALSDHVGSFFSEYEVQPVIDIDESALRSKLDDLAAELVAPPREGDLRIRATRIAPIYPAPGSRPDVEAMEGSLLQALIAAGDQEVRLRTEPVEPATTREDVDQVLAESRTAASAPIRLTRGDRAIVMEKEELTRSLEVIHGDGGDAGSLELIVDPDRLEKQIGDDAAALGTEPVDASFELVGGTVRVIPAQSGFEFSAKRSAPSVLDAALSKERVGRLRGEGVSATFTTAEARRLDITEQVSTFTTYHACCEARVENIHRIAQIVDGAVVPPGETFSLNEYVGPRTTDKGFIEAPAILNGEYVDEIGGGVSQFATTMFNAIFFGGYDLLEYKAHSYYIDRYPMGREATVSSPSPDLAFQNDSDSGIYIDTSYTDTSITITFYGNSDVEVDAVMGDPFNFTNPEMQFETNRGLAKNERVVVQEGSRGFDVVVRRVMKGNDGTEVERFFTRYLPVPEIVERGPRDKKK